MTETRYFNIHNIVKFRIEDNSNFINRKMFGGIFEEYINYFSDEIREEDLDFIVTISRKIKPKPSCYILDDKYYIDRGYLYTEDSYKLAKWRIEIIPNEDKYMINIEPNNLARFFISGFFIDFIIQYILTKKGYSILHSSGVSKNGLAYLFSGRGGSGKTSIGIHLVSSEGEYKFLGDDFIIVHRGYTHPYITPLNLFTYNLNPFLLKNLNRKKRAMMFFKKVLYSLTRGYAKFFTKLNPREAFPEKIGSKSKLSKVFIILPRNTKSDDGFTLKSISKTEAVEYVTHNQMMDSPYLPVYITQYGFLFPTDELARYWETYRNNLVQNLPDTVRFYLIYLSLSSDINKSFDKIKMVIENE
ncbi:MAG: hypothetical protein WBD09_00435 [Halobacteriota archaeon]